MLVFGEARLAYQPGFISTNSMRFILLIILALFPSAFQSKNPNGGILVVEKTATSGLTPVQILMNSPVIFGNMSEQTLCMVVLIMLREIYFHNQQRLIC
jgi:hypothetical protein